MPSPLPLLGALAALAVCILAAQCPDYDKVVSHVFQPKDPSVNYSSTEGVCACYNATVASFAHVRSALEKKYETCQWGWVKEQKVVLPRVTANERCGNSLTGLVPKMPCVYTTAENAFCFNTKVVKGVYQIYDQNQKAHLTVQERFDLCGTINATVASWGQLERAEQSGYATCSAGYTVDWMVHNVKNPSQANCSNDPTTNPTGTNSVFCSREDVKDVFQLFAQVNRTLTKEEGFDLCKTRNAVVANPNEVTQWSSSAFNACSAGWVADWKVYRLGINPIKCPNSTADPTKRSSRPVFCFREELMDSGLYKVSAADGSLLRTKDEAKSLCVSLRDNLATLADMENSSSAPLKPGLTGWCQEGVVKTGVNGTVDLLPCVNDPDVLSGVYCYDERLKDTSSANDIWSKIVMGCILASIFIILLTAALFMKGNQFICCLEKTHPGNIESSNVVRRDTVRVPIWNTTGTYKPVREILDPVYSTPVTLPQPRLPAIRPEMLHYRSHMFLEGPHSGGLPNMPEVQYKSSHIYDNLGYDATSEE